MSKADPTQSEREMRYRERQSEKGLVLVRGWVPQDKRQDVLDYMKKLREDS